MEYSRLTPCEGEWAELSEEYVQLQVNERLFNSYIYYSPPIRRLRSQFSRA